MTSLRKIGFIFAVVALCVIATAVSTFLIGKRVIEVYQQVAVDQSAVASLDGLLARLRDAESEQRGYLITGDPDYLDPKKDAFAHVRQTLSDIQQIDMSDDSRKLFAALSVLTAQKMDELKKTVETRRDQGFEAAQALVKNNTGKNLMDAIAADVSKLRDEQQMKLDDAIRAVRLMTIARTLIYVAAAIVNLYFLRWAYLLLREQARDRELAREEVQRQRDELQGQKDLLSVTLNSIGDCVIVTDLAGHITLINPVAEDLTGWTAKEAVGKPLNEVFKIISERTREVVESPVEKVMRLGQIVGLANHTLLIRKDGTEVPIDDSGAPIRDADGDIRGVVLVFRDFSARREAETKLEAAKAAAEAAKTAAETANRSKDSFLALLSHELRTPLAPVLTTLSVWEMDARLPGELKSDVEIMRRSIELEARLIDDLLDITRVEKGVLSISPELNDVHTLVESVAAMYQSEIQRRGMTLELKLGARQHFANVDPARMQQVFWNLLRNAAKFTGEGGKITVTTDNEPEGSLRIRVADTGVGISKETLTRLFLPFEQGEQKHDGLGLGLAISKAIVDAHSGAIAASSDGPGKGACLTITLPAVETPAGARLDEKHAPGAAAPGRRSLKILLLEDHGYTSQAMTRLLTARGHRVQSAGTIKAAKEMVGRESFDLMLCDLGLPDGTGMDFLRDVRKQVKTPAIALSGFGMEEDVERCTDAGFDAHMTKPIDVSKLETIMDRIDHQNHKG